MKQRLTQPVRNFTGFKVGVKMHWCSCGYQRKPTPTDSQRNVQERKYFCESNRATSLFPIPITGVQSASNLTFLHQNIAVIHLDQVLCMHFVWSQKLSPFAFAWISVTQPSFWLWTLHCILQLHSHALHTVIRKNEQIRISTMWCGW